MATMSQLNCSIYFPQLKEVVHAADGHTAHRGPHVVLRHILERVLS